MTNIVLATGNQGKVNEMQQALQEFGLTVSPQTSFNIPEAIEDGLTFVENAIIKARHACKHTGLPAIADDSGLQVDALKGAPGIYSARYAGEQCSDADNNEKLLAALANETQRSARFQCVLVMMQHECDPTPIICHGTWHGQIAQQTHGDQGFGYDPLFYIPELACHSAELAPDRKKQLSHRAQALQALKQQLKRQA